MYWTDVKSCNKKLHRALIPICTQLFAFAEKKWLFFYVFIYFTTAKCTRMSEKKGKQISSEFHIKNSDIKSLKLWYYSGRSELHWKWSTANPELVNTKCWRMSGVLCSLVSSVFEWYLYFNQIATIKRILWVWNRTM